MVTPICSERREKPICWENLYCGVLDKERVVLGDRLVVYTSRLVVKEMKVNQTSIVVLLDDQTSYEVLGQAKSCFLGDRLVVYTRQAMRCFLMTRQAMRCLDKQRVAF